MRRLSENPYQASTSELPVEVDDPEVAPFFHPVGMRKFCLLSFLSLGLYDLYWFHRQWSWHQRESGENISPFWRSLFSLLWANSCFKKIQRAGEEAGLQPSFMPGNNAIAYVLLNLLARLPGTTGLIGLFSFVPVAFVNADLIRMNRRRDPNFTPDEVYGVGAILVIVLGGIFVSLAVVGILFPESAQSR